MIREGGNRPDVIVSILKAANFSRGVTLAKITEKVNLIEKKKAITPGITKAYVAWVTDNLHGWNELHPAWKVKVL